MTYDISGFSKSPFFVDEIDNWHLLPGAPEDVVKAFEEFLQANKEFLAEGRDA